MKTREGIWKRFLKGIGIVLLALVVIIVLALGVFTIAEYRPADRETLVADPEAEATLETGTALTLVSWNCGYGALGDNADFFMDGGSPLFTRLIRIG